MGWKDKDVRHDEAYRQQRRFALGNLIRRARQDDAVLRQLRALAEVDAEVMERLRREGLL